MGGLQTLAVRLLRKGRQDAALDALCFESETKLRGHMCALFRFSLPRFPVSHDWMFLLACVLLAARGELATFCMPF